MGCSEVLINGNIRARLAGVGQQVLFLVLDSQISPIYHERGLTRSRHSEALTCSTTFAALTRLLLYTVLRFNLPALKSPRGFTLCVPWI